MEIKLLQALDQERSHSIIELGKILKLKSLEVLGVIAKINNIEPDLVINNNGKYLLSKELNWLSTELVNQFLQKEQLNYNFVLLEQLESTNSYALNHIEQFPDKTIISCNWQYAGRGRFGRSWLSRIAHDLAVSVIYYLPSDFNIAILPMLCAVAMNRMFKNHGIRSSIKWPNDIYYGSTKIVGILVESLVRNQQFKVVIGVGIDNINNLERNKLLVEVVTSLEQLISEFNSFGFALLRREWLDNCLHLNKEVTILQDGKQIATGIHSDISEQGELVVKIGKDTQLFSSSAISLLINELTT